MVQACCASTVCEECGKYCNCYWTVDFGLYQHHNSVEDVTSLLWNKTAAQHYPSPEMQVGLLSTLDFKCGLHTLSPWVRAFYHWNWNCLVVTVGQHLELRHCYACWMC
ncbi:hypothetical protein V5799_000480 [Amblyomma americanum]|uniref:Uncharacterized protein n=1 Tax=Amblyomma americanum TaxID=6943 RepID=A0AAQ4D2X4_AMBAM